jgi:benzoyl-CoA reductase/2-hydroxyglutaryl-CoA dehydratase subunit BcrC/BadD/HgdB
MLYREIMAVCSEINNKITYDALRDAVRRFHQGVLYFKKSPKMSGYTPKCHFVYAHPENRGPSLYQCTRNSQTQNRYLVQNFRQ